MLRDQDHGIALTLIGAESARRHHALAFKAEQSAKVVKPQDKQAVPHGIRPDPQIFDHLLHERPVKRRFDGDVNAGFIKRRHTIVKCHANFGQANHRQGEQDGYEQRPCHSRTDRRRPPGQSGGGTRARARGSRAQPVSESQSPTTKDHQRWTGISISRSCSACRANWSNCRTGSSTTSSRSS
jgi:hypothetical protein